MPRRTNSPPTPFGPWNLWDAKLIASIGMARRSIGTFPTAWVASQWNGTPRDLQISAICPTGKITPVSLFAHIAVTNAVSGVTASASAPRSSEPPSSTPIVTTSAG